MRRLCVLFAALLGLLLAACAPAARTPAPCATGSLRRSRPTAPQPKATANSDGGQSTGARRKRRSDARTLRRWSRRSRMIGSAALMARRSPSSNGAISSDPYCAAVSPLLKRLADAYPQRCTDRISALSAAVAPAVVSGALKQLKPPARRARFWEMEELLFANQQNLASQSGDGFPQDARSVCANRSGWMCRSSTAIWIRGKYKAKVQSAQDLAQQLGFGGTPFLLVNGEAMVRRDRLSVLQRPGRRGEVIVDYSRSVTRQAPAMQIDQNKQYTATIKTDQGDIVVKLFADKAPLAVNNFVFLAKNGWYDGVTFHRVLPGFMAQGGDPTGSGVGRSRLFIPERSDRLEV